MRDSILEYIEDDGESMLEPTFDDCLLGITDDYLPAYDLTKVLAKISLTFGFNPDQASEHFNTVLINEYQNTSFILINSDKYELAALNNKMLFLDGYQDPIGARFKYNNTISAVYDENDCITHLMEGDMTEEDAIEYFEYNTRGAYVGVDTPVFLTQF